MIAQIVPNLNPIYRVRQHWLLVDALDDAERLAEAEGERMFVVTANCFDGEHNHTVYDVMPAAGLDGLGFQAEVVAYRDPAPMELAAAS